MKYLLDTHIIMWALIDDPHLPKIAKDIIINPDHLIFYSAISPWETEIKHLKKPDDIIISGKQLTNLCEQAGFINIPVYNMHINELSNIKPIDSSIKHQDPFDRMLLAQAISEKMILLTHDQKFLNYSDIHLLVC